MKLVAIMSIEECHEALREIYYDHDVRVFSEVDIRGYPRPDDTDALYTGWFGLTDTSVYSTLSFAFVHDDEADALMDTIKDYVCEGEPDHPIHAFLLPVERAV